MTRCENPYNTWPLLTLSALRAEAGRIARGAGLGPDRCGDVTLVVSELATNGMRHGRGPVLVTLTAVGSELHVSVQDSLLVFVPLHCRAARVDEGDDGRGLAIVRACADRSSWGVHGTRKYVHAGFDLPRPTATAQIVAQLRSLNDAQVIA